MGNQHEIPPNLLKSPWLEWADDGTVTFRWKPAILLFALTVFQCVLMAWIARRTDNWLGVPMILGGATGLLIWTVVQGRRHLRVARSPGGRFRLTLADGFLLMAAIAAVAAGYSINDRQRSAELARRQQLKSDTLELLGPGGSLNRYHRGRLWLTVADPTFDDNRLKRLAELLRDDNRRYGIASFSLQLPPANTPGTGSSVGPPKGLTDQSIPILLAWRSLTDLFLVGSDLSAAGAEQLTGLPKLRWLQTTKRFDRKATARIKRARPDLWFGAAGDFP